MLRKLTRWFTRRQPDYTSWAQEAWPEGNGPAPGEPVDLAAILVRLSERVVYPAEQLPAKAVLVGARGAVIALDHGGGFRLRLYAGLSLPAQVVVLPASGPARFLTVTALGDLIEREEGA